MKNHAIHPFGFVLLAAVTVGMAGCGDSAGSSVAPTAATLSSSSAVLDSHGGGGGGNSGSGSNNSGSGNNSGPGKGNDANNQIEVNGAIQAVGGQCPALQLTIAGRKVSTSLSTEFRDTTCAKLAVGQMAEVKGTLQADGSIAATRLEGNARDNDDIDEGEVTGPITASTGACPALTLMVGTTTVKTTAATVFDDGACSALRVGAVVEAKGLKQSDGSLLAARLEAKGIE
jgi:hypothetical protein